MRNLFRLRIESPENQPGLFTYLDAGEGDGPRLAIVCSTRATALAEAVERVLRGRIAEFEMNAALPTPGAWLQDLEDALAETLAIVPENQARDLRLAVVLASERSLYVLHSADMQPYFSHGDAPQPLASTLRIRVKELGRLHDDRVRAWSAGDPGLRLVRVFFDDDDRVVLWLPGGTPPAEVGAEVGGTAGNVPVAHPHPPAPARIVILKEPVQDAEPVRPPAAAWPTEATEPPRDRVTMSYVALAVVVVVFLTALFGMWRWQRMGEPQPFDDAVAGLVDTQDHREATAPPPPPDPSHVEATVVDEPRVAPATAEAPPLEVARVEPKLQHEPVEPAVIRPRHLEVAWKRTHDAWVTSSPRRAEGYVVYGCRDGRLYAVDVAGAPRWSYNSGAGIGATPEVDGTRVFCGNYAGRAFALRALDGYELWHRDLGARIVASPAAGHQNVYFQTYGGDLVALEKRSGRFAWKRHLGGQLRARPLIVDKGTLVAISAQGDAVCLRQKDGETIWVQSLGAGVISSPTRAGDRIVFGTRKGTVVALRVEDGSVAWRFRARGAVNASPATDGERIFIGSSDHTLYALAAKDGAPVWTFRTQGAILSTPALHEGKVYVTSYDRHAYVVDASTGALLARAGLEAPIYSSPLVVDGHIYVGANTGRFYCLNDPS